MPWMSVVLVVMPWRLEQNGFSSVPNGQVRRGKSGVGLNEEDFVSGPWSGARNGRGRRGRRRRDACRRADSAEAKVSEAGQGGAVSARRSAKASGGGPPRRPSCADQWGGGQGGDP